jgi:hypothetical protein
MHWFSTLARQSGSLLEPSAVGEAARPLIADIDHNHGGDAQCHMCPTTSLHTEMSSGKFMASLS